MKVKMYSIYDVKSGQHSYPSCNPAREQARRSFVDEVNSGQDNTLTRHPEDFTLFEVAEFDVLTGEITPLEAKFPVCNGLDVKVVGQ